MEKKQHGLQLKPQILTVKVLEAAADFGDCFFGVILL